MNKRIMKKKAFQVVNEATEFTLRVRHPNTFIKEGYRLMKVFKSEPSLFMKRGQKVAKKSELTVEEMSRLFKEWRTPGFEEERQRKQEFINKYGRDVVFVSDEKFDEIMSIRRRRKCS